MLAGARRVPLSSGAIYSVGMYISLHICVYASLHSSLPSLSLQAFSCFCSIWVFLSFFSSTHHPLKMSFNCLHLICTQTPFRVHLWDSFSPEHHPLPQAEVLHKQALQGLPNVPARHLEEGQGPEPPSTGSRVGKSPCRQGTNDLGSLHSHLRHSDTAHVGDGANSSQRPLSLHHESLPPRCSDLWPPALQCFLASAHLPQGLDQGVRGEQPLSQAEPGTPLWDSPLPWDKRVKLLLETWPQKCAARAQAQSITTGL